MLSGYEDINMKKFALIGAAGYVAPRHMKAIKDTGNILIAAVDPNDSVGVLDSFFPECKFFTEIERFDRHLEKLRQQNEGIDYISICSPNYLHDSHCRLALRLKADVICEKPLVLNPWNLDQLKTIEKDSGKRISNILQLRNHPELIKLKEKVDNSSFFYNVTLKYVIPRGPWYHVSWKGKEGKSGGILTNIGIHFFDMLLWIFGPVKSFKLNLINKEKAEGELFLEKASVKWFLSTDRKDSPTDTAYRSLTVDNNEIRFDKVFNDLHTVAYQNIINGNSFNIDECRPSIKLVYNMKRHYAMKECYADN